jgi:two-component system, NarL family, sensor kinase
VTVRDDGSGIAEGTVSGVGTQSMRERTAELGGTIEIGPGEAGRGTMICARLPLEGSA